MSADFLDSNILVYLSDPTDPRKSEIALRIVERGLGEQAAIISYQVVQETLNAILRKAESPATVEDAHRLLHDVLLPLWALMPTDALFRTALDLRGRYQFHFYDALIVAAALEGGCDRLLSEDFQHGQRIEGLVVENPFLAA